MVELTFVVGPEVANILEFTAGFRANLLLLMMKPELGAVKVGSLTKKFDVIVDPYFLAERRPRWTPWYLFP